MQRDLREGIEIKRYDLVEFGIEQPRFVEPPEHDRFLLGRIHHERQRHHLAELELAGKVIEGTETDLHHIAQQPIVEIRAVRQCEAVAYIDCDDALAGFVHPIGPAMVILLPDLRVRRGDRRHDELRLIGARALHGEDGRGEQRCSNGEEESASLHAFAMPIARSHSCFTASGIPAWKGKVGMRPGSTRRPTPSIVPSRSATGSMTLRATAGSRITAFGSPPAAIVSRSFRKRRRIMEMPRSLVLKNSLSRCAIAPWPIQAMKSWFMMWLERKRPVFGSRTGPFQVGIVFCS